MFKDHPVKQYLIYSLVAAVAYFIVVCIFISYGSFDHIWILYVGNTLFAICITIFILRYNHGRKENAKIGMMLFAGLVTVVLGVIIVCILILLTYLVVPHVFYSVPAGTTAFLKAPPQMEGKTSSFIFNIVMNAIIGNVSAGAFIAILLPYAAKRDQKAQVSEVNVTDT